MVQHTRSSTRTAAPRRAPGAALVAGAGGALAVAIALTVRVAELIPGRGPAITRVDQIVELAVLAVGVLVAWWLAAGLVAAAGSAGARAFGLTWAVGERFVAQHAPTIVRQGLAVSIGAGVGLLAAVGPAGAQSPGPPADLGWAATQVDVRSGGEATGPAPSAPVSAPPVSAPPVTAPPPAPGPGVVTVTSGDSLWSIAARSLDAGANPGEIAAAWPLWFAANRDVIGDDPDRIRPGQVLTEPAAAAANDRGASS